MVDYIADYLENIRDRRVFPDVKPGYMRDLIPENAPMDGEKWENIFNDVETVIMPGVTFLFSSKSHYLKSQIFVQKFNFDKTLQFSREIKVVNN